MTDTPLIWAEINLDAVAANVRELRQLCARYGIRIYLDATRMAENVFFIQERELGYADKSIARDSHRCSWFSR